MFCRECGAEINSADKFCTNCGRAVVVPQPQVVDATPEVPAVPVAPAAPAVSYTPAVPVAPAVPVVSTRTKVFGIIGMALAIEGLINVGVGLLYAFLAMGLASEDGIASAVTNALVSIPFAVVGLIMSVRSRRRGFQSTVTAVGLWCSLASLIVLVAAVVCVVLVGALASSGYSNYI